MASADTSPTSPGARVETERRRLLDPEPEPGWETLFWNVFERTLNPIILLDESRHTLEANSAAVELLGYRPRDLVGRSSDELITSPPQAQRDTDWRRPIQTGEWSGTYTLRRRDGS